MFVKIFERISKAYMCAQITNKKNTENTRVFKINKYCILNFVLENVENIHNNLRNSFGFPYQSPAISFRSATVFKLSSNYNLKFNFVFCLFLVYFIV